MNFKKLVKSIQTAGYNGACRVYVLKSNGLKYVEPEQLPTQENASA